MKYSATTFAMLTGGLTLMIAAVLSATPHEAQFPIPVEEFDARRSAVFTEVDSNGDGLISIEEFNAHEPRRDHPGRAVHYSGKRHAPKGHGRRHSPHMNTDRADFDEQMFTALDVDADGVLSKLEFSHEAMAAARQSIMKERMFDRFDANDDGYLSADEFPPNRVAMLDRNADGEISRDEIRRHHDRPDAD